MCGICGLVALDGAAVDPRGPSAMARRAARTAGPTSEGMDVDGPVALAARRLSIIDLARGHQPMRNEDGDVVVVQNGEIYNHAALRDELARPAGTGSRPAATPRCSCTRYEEHGPTSLERLRGMFAHRASGTRASDGCCSRATAFGIKPLLLAGAGRRARPSPPSSRRCVRQPGFREELDLDALEAYLAFNCDPGAAVGLPRRAQAAAGPPAGVAPRRRAGGAPVGAAAPVPAAAMRREDEGVLAHELRGVLRDSVRAHLVADVPVGVFLSGGIDSGALAALAAEQVQRARCAPSRSDSRSGRSTSSPAPARSRPDTATDHHELVLRAADAADLLPRVVGRVRRAFGGLLGAADLRRLRLAARHVKVTLSGEGGDELFGGYQTYVAALLAPRLGRPARALLPVIERLPSSSRRVPPRLQGQRFARAAALGAAGAPSRLEGDLLAPMRGRRCSGRAPPGRPAWTAWRARWAETAGAEPLARLQDLDKGIYLADDLLTKSDRAIMAHSLEVRVPFCDVTSRSLRSPCRGRMKVRALQTKRLLRQAVAPLLPRSVVHGPKRGFSIPAAAWLRGPLLPAGARRAFARRAALCGTLRPGDAGRLLDEHERGRDDHSRALWGLVCFALWSEGR